MNKSPKHEQALALVSGASADTVDYMQRKGWERCTEVLDEPDAVVATEDELDDPDYAVAVTRTCSGFIVWRTLN